jgi:serpin B
MEPFLSSHRLFRSLATRGVDKMKTVPYLTLITIVLAILAGCVCPVSSKPPGLSAQSNKARVKSPDVPAADQAELIDGNNAFALDLYRYLKDKEVNFFYSPYSISLALAMTYAGARGETEQQMADTLHYTLPQDQLHPAFNWLDLELESRGTGAKGKDGEPFQLYITNATWGPDGYEFLPEYLDTLVINYGAGMQLLDFAGDPDGSRVAINDWVSDQTEGRIQDLIPPDVIDSLTRLVLTNAIYFSGAWAEAFDEELTTDGAFHLLDGSQVTVPMMTHTASYGYAEGEGYRAVELPYQGGELSMVIVLPDEGTFEAYEDLLDGDSTDAIVDSLTYREATLTMPKFEIASDFSLVDALTTLGMPTAFSSGADFSGMDGTQELFVGEVLHKSFITVDEAGTEAAAATAVEMQLKGAPVEPIEVTVDRPFLFFIRDVETGAILFVGRIMDPTS